MKVKELVQIEEVEEVVKITHHDPGKIVETFVADERLEGQICFLLERFLQRREKNSFFIIGGYGTGKSHLLAFLGDLFQHPHLWEKVRNERIRSFAPEFQGKRFHPIWIHLSPGRVDLQDYIWLELERQLSDILGEPVYLAPAQYIRKAEEDPRFESFLREKERTRESWEYLKSSHPEEALDLGRQFFSKIGTRPEIEEEVEGVMERALSLLNDKFGGYNALVLIVDELYDFLRGKGGGTAEFARDIAFLRDLGEASAHYNFFVLASLQEDILDPEKMGAERENLNRIRQRYENFQIPYFNLQKVARERVLKKSEAQVEELRKLYSLLRKNYFPSLAFDERSFVDLYPVHPAILHFYERVVREVGPRSIISFLSQSAKEIEEQDYDTLVTLSELYDHLEGELASHTNYGVLVRDIVPYFREGIPLWMEEEEREWALKAIKALAILHIVGEKRKCRELAEFILYRVIEDVNYQFFAHLMEKLFQQGTYIYLAEGMDIDAVYVIQTEGIPVEILVESEAGKIRDDDPGLWNEVLRGLREMGVPREMEIKGWCGLRVEWRGTERKGEGRFISEADPYLPEEANDRLKEGDVDFLLLILRPNLPADYLSQKELRDERILVWRPEELGGEELHRLKRRLAIRRLLEGGQPKEVMERLQAMAIRASEEVEQLVEEVYWRRGSLPFLLTPLPKPFAETLHKCLEELLARLYPRHPQFPRKIGRKTARDLIRYLSKLSPPTPTLEDYAEDLSSTGLLLKEGEGEYYIREDLEYYQLIMDALKVRDFASVEEVYKKLREKPYGLTEDIVEFLILALVSKGLLSVKGMGREFFRHNLEELVGFNFFLPHYYLHKLEIEVTPEVIELLREIFGSKVKTETQEERSSLWEELRKLLEQYNLQQLGERLRGFHSPFNKDLLLNNLGKVKGLVEDLFQVIRENVSPEEGFRKLGELVEEKYRDYIEAWKGLKSLEGIGELQGALNREIDYLQGISLPPGERLSGEGNELLAELVGSRVEDENFLRNWLERVNFLKQQYIERYTALHEEVVGNNAPWWEELEGIKKDALLRTLKEVWGIIGGVGVSNPGDVIGRKVEDLLGRKCDRLYKDSLKNYPLCPHCEFKPAHPPDLKGEIERVRRMVNEEWGRTVEELRRKEEDIRRAFEGATSAASEGMEKLLKGEPVPLSEEMKERLRRALGKLKIIEVNLTPYIRDGGIYRVEEFMERIREALRGAERGENVRIKIRLI